MSELCPAEGVAQAYLERRLDRAQRAAFERHLASCGLCRGVVRLLGSQVGIASDSGSGGVDDPIGPTFGRFRLEHRAGAGAFGTIWIAHDPEIDRKVAVKVLAADAARDEAAIREARALGRIVHPNLVTVFEVGEAQGRPYLVMEWIDGVDLRRWSGRRRGWREIVETLLQAGRGLAALHGVGVLHRDVKPANAIVDEAGRVRVVDLGLARFAAMPTVDEAREDLARSEHDLTRLAGSPAYMAPEIWRGHAAHEGSDQFSYCVTLFECLYGVRPFAGDTGTELLDSMTSGDVAVRRGLRRVPGWLRAVIVRGLAPDPSARWPSLQSLIAALERGLARRRRWRTAGVAVGLVTIVGGTAAGSMQRTRAAATCRALGEGATEVWNAARATELAATLGASAVPHAEQTAQRVVAALDAYALAWSDARIEVCEATEIDGRVSREAMTNRAACLDDARVELRATLDVLASADEATLDGADRVVAGLRAPADCIDGVDASSVVAAPDDAPISAGLARSRALRVGGDPARAHELSSSLLATTPASQRARVLLEIASCEEELGRYEAGKAALDEALGLALSQQDWPLVQQIATVAISLVGSRLGRPDAGLVYAELARGLLPPSGALHARSAIEHNVGHALMAAERFEAASAAYRRAIADDISRYGARHPEVATSRDALGSALRELGDLQGAIDESRLALAIRAEALGPHHRALVHSHDNLSIALEARGELAEAESHVLAAIDIEARYTSRGPDLAALHTQLGIVREEQGRTDEALTAFERATQLTAEAFGPRDARTAETLINVAVVRQRIGDLARARTDIDAALAVLVQARGPDHLSVARVHGTRAGILAAAGDLEGALAADRTALAIKRETLGDAHIDVARSRANLGETLIALERWNEAIAELEQAVTAFAAADAAPTSRANASFLLARALVGTGRDLPRARGLAVAARELLAAADGDHAEHLAEIDDVIEGLGVSSALRSPP